MNKLIGGIVVGVFVALSIAAGFQPRDNNGGIVNDFAPRAYKHYSSTKIDYTYNVTNVSKFKVKPTANVDMYLNSKTGTPKTLAANTEYTIGVAVPSIVFDLNSSATKTKLWIEEQ